MIDIHTHILPGIDDGADNMEMTLEMLSIAAMSGVTDIVATPHANIPGVYENYDSSDLQKLARDVLEAKNRARIPVRLHRGMEIYATDELPRLLSSGRVWTLGGTSCFLTEFSFAEDPQFCDAILKECSSLGFRPVIAHPERYYFVQEYPQIAYEWCIRGYALQINKGSLLGRFGRKEQDLAQLLISHGLAACVASDAHKHDRRSTYMREVELRLRQDVGESYTDVLLEKNPRRILSGERLLGYEPIPFDRRVYFSEDMNL